MTFAAIDFETATGYRNSACAVGIVSVENGIIIDEYSTLIQPPFNEYNWHNTQVHGITPQDTYDAPQFIDIFHEVRKRLEGKVIVAHNEPFDRSVLKHTMSENNFEYDDYDFPEKWECTLKIYKGKGYKPATLNACCEINNIQLNHHEALSDARGCALLYLKR